MGSFSEEGMAFRPAQGARGVVNGSETDGDQNHNRWYGCTGEQCEDQPLSQTWWLPAPSP